MTLQLIFTAIIYGLVFVKPEPSTEMKPFFREVSMKTWINRTVFATNPQNVLTAFFTPCQVFLLLIDDDRHPISVAEYHRFGIAKTKTIEMAQDHNN